MPTARLRIAILTRNFARTAGGAESYSISIAQELAERHEVHVYCQETDRPIPLASYHLIFRPCRRPRWINQLWYALATWWLTRRGWDAVISHEHVFHGNVQVLHVQSVAQGTWGGLQGWRKARRWLGVFTSLRRMTYLALESARMKTIPGRRLVFASASLLEGFKQTYAGIEAISCIIEPGVYIPLAPLARHACRQQLGWSNEPGWVLFVANDYRRKGLDALLLALTRLPQSVRLAVVGQARQQPVYEALARDLGLTDRVQFMGPREDIDVCMSAADVLVHPTREDSFGMVVLEAMACGLPVIVSRAPYCGFAAELQHQQDAMILDDPGDAQHLAATIQTVLDDSELRLRLRTGGEQQARRRTWSTAALKYEKIIEP